MGLVEELDRGDLGILAEIGGLPGLALVRTARNDRIDASDPPAALPVAGHRQRRARHFERHRLPVLAFGIGEPDLVIVVDGDETAVAASRHIDQGDISQGATRPVLALIGRDQHGAVLQSDDDRLAVARHRLGDVIALYHPLAFAGDTGHVRLRRTGSQHAAGNQAEQRRARNFFHALHTTPPPSPVPGRDGFSSSDGAAHFLAKRPPTRLARAVFSRFG